MFIKQLNVLMLAIIVASSNEVQSCTNISFNETTMQVHYSKRNFVYETDSEMNLLSTDKKNISIYGCISPFTTPLIDNNHRGTVQQITINNQNVPVLYAEAISDFKTIWLISLQNNKITTIKRAAFSNLPQLEILQLSSNEIISMDDDVFNNVPHLHSLYMEHNNLKTFEKEWLGNLPELYVFSLAFNNIQNLPRASFDKLETLRILDLSHNKILHIHNKAFDGLPALEMLDLGYNKINHIQDDLFRPTSNLRVLNLYANNLTYILPEALKSLTILEDLIVLSNPLTCKCYDVIFQWATKKGVDMKNSYLKCQKTDDIENIPVCVTTNDTECITDTNEDLFSILHTVQFDFQCILEPAVIKIVYD